MPERLYRFFILCLWGFCRNAICKWSNEKVVCWNHIFLQLTIKVDSCARILRYVCSLRDLPSIITELSHWVEGSCFRDSEVNWLFRKVCRVKGLKYLELSYDNVLTRSFCIKGNYYTMQECNKEIFWLEE